MSETKKRKSFKFLPFIVLTAFFLSFSLAAYFFITSENLVVERNGDEIKRLTSELAEKENEITELKYQLERLTALYEKELSLKPPLNIEN